MSGRRARELPKVDIGGNLFYVDVRLNELRHTQDFMNRITIDEDIYDSGRNKVVLFDTTSNGIFRGDHEELGKRFQKDVIEIKVPSLKEMDPEGFEWLLDDILEESPIICARIKDHPEVINAIAQKFAPKKLNEPLLKKNRVRNNKVKRL